MRSGPLEAPEGLPRIVLIEARLRRIEDREIQVPVAGQVHELTPNKSCIYPISLSSRSGISRRTRARS
jgi:hypothetical protein